MKLNTWAGPLLTLAFLIWFSIEIGWTEVTNNLSTLTYTQLVWIVLLIFTSYLVRSLRLYFYIPSLRNQKLPVIKLTLQHNFFNNLLPMRAGELSFPLLMKQYFKTPIATSVGTLLWFRILDLQALCLLGLASWITHQAYRHDQSVYWIGLLALVSLVTPYVIFCTSRGLNQQCALNAQDASQTNQAISRLKNTIQKLQPGLPKNHRDYTSSSLLTLLNWSIKVYTFTLILKSLAPLTTTTAILGAIAGEVSTVLPIHGIGGIGTYEAAVATPMYLQGTSKTTAISAALNLHLLVLVSTGLSYLVSLRLPTPKH